MSVKPHSSANLVPNGDKSDCCRQFSSTALEFCSLTMLWHLAKSVQWFGHEWCGGVLVNWPHVWYSIQNCFETHLKRARAWWGPGLLNHLTKWKEGSFYEMVYFADYHYLDFGKILLLWCLNVLTVLKLSAILVDPVLTGCWMCQCDVLTVVSGSKINLLCECILLGVSCAVLSASAAVVSHRGAWIFVPRVFCDRLWLSICAHAVS